MGTASECITRMTRGDLFIRAGVLLQRFNVERPGGLGKEYFRHWLEFIFFFLIHDRSGRLER